MKTAGPLLLAAMWSCACSCSGDKAAAPAPRGSAVLASAPPSTSASQPARDGKPAPATKAGAKATRGAKPTPSKSPAIDAGTAGPKIVEQEELKTEEPEANPYSESVTLKLSVTPRVNALVLWGAKQMAHLEVGKMDAEITRPRGSGPLDLEIKAEGYLPYHTRLYADRNDKLGVRLYRPEEAPAIFGYKRSVEKSK
jgi:hypothetical protein